VVALAALGSLCAAHAGSQLEEPLADAVRTALSAAVHHSAPPVPGFADAGSRAWYQQWLGVNAARLASRMPDHTLRVEFLQTLWYEAKRAGLDVSLVLGLVQVESAFRKFALSRAGARGYMQVMPFWTSVIGDGDPSALFDARTNLRYGCVILRHYIDIERGDLFRALGRYNGSLGRPEYPNAVLAAWKRWSYDNTPVIQQVSAPTVIVGHSTGR
jgi:soluble lytic murein transglycosylase-like protein